MTDAGKGFFLVLSDTCTEMLADDDIRASELIAILLATAAQLSRAGSVPRAEFREYADQAFTEVALKEAS